MDRTAKRAPPVASVRASGDKLTTRRNILRPKDTPGPSAPEINKTTAMGRSKLSGTKSSDSGCQRPSTTSAANGGSSFKCKCGRNYLSKATLARHQKECGTRDTTACQFCGAKFPTFAGVRQHERRRHPELYQQELEANLPAPDSVLFAQIADIEARADSGIFYDAMVSATGLTKNQVRYRRERPEYQEYLARARKKLHPPIPPQASHPDPPNTPRASRYQRRVQIRSPKDDARATDSSSPAAPQIDAPCARLLRATITIPVAPAPVVHETHTTTLPPTVVPVPSTNGNDRATDRPPPFPDLPPPQDTALDTLATIPVTSPIHDTRISPVALPNLAKRRRLSCSLPSLLLSQPMEENATGEPSTLGAIERDLTRILNGPPDVLTSTTGAMDAVRSALEETSDHVQTHIDRWLDSFQGDDRKAKRRVRARVGPANYGQSNTGRGSRAATFKKVQDLFTKNRKGLAEAILEGRDIHSDGTFPSLEGVTELFGGILERPSPPDHHPYRLVEAGAELSLDPITPEEVAAAKAGWRISSAGVDGVSVQSVKNRGDLELSILFNIVLLRNVQPTYWRDIRTTLVPKAGDRELPTNWRPISVGSAVQRLLHRVLVSRMKSSMRFSEHQRGFVETDGTLANAMILHEYIHHRSELRKGYNVVSLDIRKAFDTVSHHSIRRALERFRVPDHLIQYIMSTFEATTTLNLGRSKSRPINFRSGVRQGDPLSPLLFNAVMDELLVLLNERFTGGSLPNGARCAAMAFADDLILMTDQELEVPLMLDEVETFLKHRGMEVNAAKCRALVARTSAGRSVPRSRAIFQINNSPIPIVPGLNVFRYLGHDFGHNGMEKPGLYKLPEWLSNISKAPLKPDQKLLLLKVYVLPRLLYSLQNPKITSRSLRDADRLLRKSVRNILHLNCHTPDASIHAKVRDGGLGVMELRTAIPRIFLGRLVGLLERSTDQVVLAVLQSDTARLTMSKLQHMAGDIPGPTVWRGKIASGVLTKGLEQAAEDSASRIWVDAKPVGWSGRDFVKAVQLRTANLPTKAIPSNPTDQRRCRGGCPCDENISHVLQTCPVTHWERIRRHDEIVSKVAKHCRTKRWIVEEEPHVRHRGGQLFKPDLAIHQPDNITVVADIQVAWDSTELPRAYERKRVVYDNATFREAAEKRWPGKTLLFAPVILGARGIWPRVNNERSAVLSIPPVVRRSCVHSVLRWGSTIHTAFMKAVWRKQGRPISSGQGGKEYG